jgi:ABC-type transport system involved in multi-copper enzyme maturation permease subunit
MSTDTASGPDTTPTAEGPVAATPRAVAGGYRMTWPRIVRSEWIRFVTVRANLWTRASLVVVMVGIGLIAAGTSTGSVSAPGPAGGRPGFSGTDPLTIVLAGQTLAVLVIGVLGVLVGVREYGSGMVRTTMAAVPRRLPVLAARIVVFVAVTGLVVLVSTVGAYLGGTAVLENGGAATAAWSEPGVPRAVLGTAAYLVGIGIIGICLGMLTRSIGFGVGSLIGLILVVPGFASLLLPDDWKDAVGYLPSQAGSAFTTITTRENLLSPGTGALVYAVWLVAAVTAAAVALRRRDV